MRIIDADKLRPDMKIFTSAYSTELTKCYSQEAIDNAPTVDAEPVRHGEWTEKKSGKGIWDYYFVCSECHKNTPDKAYIISPDFCPWCGAIMDGGDKHDT